MTKLRAPLSFELALDRVCSLIGWDRAGELIGKAERTVRDYGDPDIDTGIALEHALTLDKAYRAAGGDGLPIVQCYLFRLETEAAVPGHDAEALSRLIASAAIEGGQAIAALVAATRPGARPADYALARRETEQAMCALSHTLPMLDGAGPSSDRVTPLGGATS